jgi:signal transduction histidine kinase
MSLRMRLFVLIGGLAALLVLAQVLLVRSLAREVADETGQVAFEVGEDVVSWLAAVPAEAGAVAQATPLPVAGPGTVTERAYYLRETERGLELVDQRVSVGRASVAAGAPARDMTVTLAIDSPMRSHFLELHGPAGKERIPIPRAGLEGAIERFQRRMLVGSSGLLAAALALAAVIAHRATAPLRDLARAARELGEGRLGTQVDARASGEVAEALGAFNLMSARLAELDAESQRLREREHLGEIGEIARGLAHGLRNPLNALGLTVDELAERSPERADLATSARRQIRRIDNAIRSFLTLASSGRGAPEEDLDLSSIGQDVVLEALQDARGRVSVAIESQARAPMRGVAAEVRAVVQALVVNAVEASPDGARVVARVERLPDGGARLLVDDDGPGLADDVRARLFLPHVTTKSSGAGMGLFLAQRLVAARGGTLELLPREPHGTRAIVEWPAHG